MEIMLDVQGVQVKAYVDDNEIAEAIRRKKSTGYERVARGKTYYRHRGTGTVDDTQHELLTTTDTAIFECGDYYSDKKVAENNIRADNLMRNLRRFAAQHGGCRQPGQSGYEIYWNRAANMLTAIDVCDCKDVGGIVFTDKDAANKAIVAFRSELAWYFNEYDPMPKGWWDTQNEI